MLLDNEIAAWKGRYLVMRGGMIGGETRRMA